jgi:hypothetical protein
MGEGRSLDRDFLGWLLCWSSVCACHRPARSGSNDLGYGAVSHGTSSQWWRRRLSLNDYRVRTVRLEPGHLIAGVYPTWQS